jgi:hypothetical protein
VNDVGIIAPTAALSCFPFLPLKAEAARRYFLEITGGLFFEEFGFVYAFCRAEMGRHVPGD